MNALSKGITTNKQERDRIPIKTMFGNDEDAVERHNSKLRYDEDGAEIEGSSLESKARQDAGHSSAVGSQRCVLGRRKVEDEGHS